VSVAGHDIPDDDPNAGPPLDDQPPHDPWPFPPPPPADWEQTPPPPWGAPPQPQYGPAATATPQADAQPPVEEPPASADPWRIPPQPPWNPATEPPPGAPPSSAFHDAEPPRTLPGYAPGPRELTAFDLPPSATGPRSTPRPPSDPRQELRPAGAPPTMFDEPWRRETPHRTGGRVRLRPILIAVAGLMVAALVAWGVLVLLPDGRKPHAPAGPAAHGDRGRP
jgi:hypothetical protein